eukprot:Pgem_evm1s6817
MTETNMIKIKPRFLTTRSISKLLLVTLFSAAFFLSTKNKISLVHDSNSNRYLHKNYGGIQRSWTLEERMAIRQRQRQRQIRPKQLQQNQQVILPQQLQQKQQGNVTDESQQHTPGLLRQEQRLTSQQEPQQKQQQDQQNPPKTLLQKTPIKQKVAVCIIGDELDMHITLFDNWKEKFIKEDYELFYSSNTEIKIEDQEKFPWKIVANLGMKARDSFTNHCHNKTEKMGYPHLLPFAKKFTMCSLMILRHQEKNPHINYTHAVHVNSDMVFSQKMSHVSHFFGNQSSLGVDVLHFQEQLSVVKGGMMRLFFNAVEIAYGSCYGAKDWLAACPAPFLSEKEVSKKLNENTFPCSPIRMVGPISGLRIQTCIFVAKTGSIDCGIKNDNDINNEGGVRGSKKYHYKLDHKKNGENQEDLCDLNNSNGTGSNDNEFTAMEKRKGYVMTLPFTDKSRLDSFLGAWNMFYPQLEMEPIYGSLTETRGLGLVFSFINAVDLAIEDDVDVAFFFEDDALPFAEYYKNKKSWLRDLEKVLKKWSTLPNVINLYLGGHAFYTPGKANYEFGLTRVIHSYGTYGFAIRKKHLKCYSKLLRDHVEKRRYSYDVDYMLFCLKGHIFRLTSKYQAMVATPLLIDHNPGFSYTWKKKIRRPFEGVKEWDKFEDSIVFYDANNRFHTRISRCELSYDTAKDKILIGVMTSSRQFVERVDVIRKSLLLNNDGDLDIHFIINYSENINISALAEQANVKLSQVHVLQSLDDEYEYRVALKTKRIFELLYSIANTQHVWVFKLEADTFLRANPTDIRQFKKKINKSGFWGKVETNLNGMTLHEIGLKKYCVRRPGYVMSIDVLAQLILQFDDCVQYIQDSKLPRKLLEQSDLLTSYCVHRYGGHLCESSELFHPN